MKYTSRILTKIAAIGGIVPIDPNSWPGDPGFQRPQPVQNPILSGVDPRSAASNAWTGGPSEKTQPASTTATTAAMTQPTTAPTTMPTTGKPNVAAYSAQHSNRMIPDAGIKAPNGPTSPYDSWNADRWAKNLNMYRNSGMVQPDGSVKKTEMDPQMTSYLQAHPDINNQAEALYKNRTDQRNRSFARAQNTNNAPTSPALAKMDTDLRNPNYQHPVGPGGSFTPFGSPQSGIKATTPEANNNVGSAKIPNQSTTTAMTRINTPHLNTTVAKPIGTSVNPPKEGPV